MRLIDADALIRELNEKIGCRTDINKIICGMTVYEPAIVQPQCIPVAERLPEHYRNEDGTLIPFIVCVRNCKNPVVAYYNGEIWGDMGRMDVIAWAPTPEPYKEDEHD